MSLSYTLRESISGFTRARLSTIISIFTVTISLLLLGVFVVLTLNAARFIDELRNKVELEAFLQEPLSRQDIAELEKRILAVEGVERITFISKDEAARIFLQEFGEDITKVLDFNPLPPSFKISLKDNYKTSAGAQEVNDKVLALKGVDHVLYRKALLTVIDERAASINNITLGLGVLVSLSAIFLVSNTIRLAIHAKRRLIRTMELVGATGSFIRLPFLLEGIIQGFIGGLIATGILYFLLEYAALLISTDFSSFLKMQRVFYLMVVAGGTVLGLLGSLISIARFITPARHA